jgi:hypothetical protein
MSRFANMPRLDALRIIRSFDPVTRDLVHHLREETSAESRAEEVDRLTNEIASAPSADQFADAFTSMGCGKGEMQRLLTAYTQGRDAFMREVFEQLNAGFASVADFEITADDEREALACDARDVLSDWE